MAIKDPWEWLSLVDVDGPFLSRAALKSVFPNGLDRPYNAIDDVNSTFVYEHTVWSKAWTARQGQPGAAKDLAWRDRWVTAVLRDLLQWGDYLDGNPGSTIVASSPDGDVTVRPWAALDAGDGPAALVVVVDPTDDLRRTGADGWAADAIDRTAALLREAKVSVGLVTDGRWWGIVSAVREVTTASGVFDSLIWREERDSRDAFLALAGLVSLAGGASEKRLPKLFELSVASAEAITEALGDQVRRAVELVLQAMSESHLRAIANGQESPLPEDSKQVYEAAVSVLMRVVFLLFAEERALLPQHQMYRDSYAISGVRGALEHQAQNDTEEALDHTWETWHRLLAASTAIYSGANFEDTRMPAYGGSLFDPARFPWLRATNTQGQLSVRVSDRVMLRVLRAVQVADVGGEARRLSFRDLDVEQIGYVYEGLLGYSAEYTQDVAIGLQGKSGYEPEIALTELLVIAEAARGGADFAKKLIDHLGKSQPNSTPATASKIAKAFDADVETTSADARSRLEFVLLGHTELIEKLAPLHALIRDDLRDFPYVVPAGGLVMTESPQRANTGSHYTPRSLAEEVVLHALEPLVFSPGPLETENSEDWVLKSSTEILNLKIADIAVGSGAFLVAAARYLAERLIEARSKEGLSAAANEDARRWAIREVVARCLYGADINGLAVEMCKLSLWLVSMDPTKPFSFVDDRVFHGNSLLGVTTERQLRAQHIDPSHSRILQRKLLQLDVDSDLARAAQLRRELSSGQVDDADRMRSVRAKRKLLDESREVTTRLRDVADGVIATGLLEGGKPGRGLEARYNNLADALYAAYPQKGTQGDRGRLEAILAGGLTPTVNIGESRWRPLHWILEAPDVFRDHGGFDAIIGNPPFLGGKKISGANGPEFREFLVHSLAESRKGEADLVGYFLLRAVSLLSPRGFFGLIVSESLSEGEGRRVVLDSLLESQVELYQSQKRRKWPTKASVHVSLIWGTRAKIGEVGRSCDGQRVTAISSNLEPQTRFAGPPVLLAENGDLSFMGAILSGQGFVLTQQEYDVLLAVDPTSAEVCRPYVSGGDVNNAPRPGATRYVIDFGTRALEDARRFPAAIKRVEELVKPTRDKARKKPYRERWWLFAERGRGLSDGLSGVDSVIGIVLTSDTLMPVRLDSNAVFSNSIGVFLLPSHASLAVLSSSIHQLWAMKWGSSLDAASRYTTSDVFETFPRPKNTDSLTQVGKTLDEVRSEIMLRRGLGLTQLYKRVNSRGVPGEADQDIDKLRTLHIEVDYAVLAAYGWTDIPLDHGFHTYRQMERFTVSPAARVEILDRLLEENYRRAALETQNGRKSLAPLELDLDPETAPEGAMF